MLRAFANGRCPADFIERLDRLQVEMIKAKGTFAVSFLEKRDVELLGNLAFNHRNQDIAPRARLCLAELMRRDAQAVLLFIEAGFLEAAVKLLRVSDVHICFLIARDCIY